MIEPEFTPKQTPTSPPTDLNHKGIPKTQGWPVLISGIVGIAFGIAPIIFYAPGWGLVISGKVYSLFGIAPGFFLIPYVKIPVLTCWACIVGIPFTTWWSKALHNRITAQRQARAQIRVQWLPAWIGVFERAFYCILIGYNISGAAALIGVWVGLKSAGGWQKFSKGTTYGRAIFFSGLLGDCMSALFGIVAGTLIGGVRVP